MRSYNVLLLITLVIIGLSNAFEFTNLAEVKELRSSSYGNSLIETISLTLQSSGTTGDVTKLLNDLLYKLNKDQEDSDAAWNTKDKDLADKIDSLTKAISSLSIDVATDKASQTTFEGLRDDSKTNLDQFNKQQQDNINNLSKNEDNRNKDIANYKASVQDHNDVINAIDQVVTELNKLSGSISGVNKPAHVEDIEAETRDRAYLAKSFVQLTKDENQAMLFVEMATTADQEALKKLIGLLNGLSDSSKKSLNDDEAHEADSKKTYEALKAALGADNIKLADSIKSQQANLKTYLDKVSALIAKIADEQTLLDSKKAEKDSTIAQRHDLEVQYKSDKAERDGERAVLQKLQKIVQDRLNKMSNFLK